MKKDIYQSKLSIVRIILILFLLMVIGCSDNQKPPQPYVKPANAKIKLRSDIVFLTASELAQKIKNGDLTSLEVVDAFLSQIYQYNPKLNAVITVNAENARKRAKEADAALTKGEIWGPLHGVPVTLKDHFATKSIRTTSGYLPLANHVPNFDATIVVRLKKAGAIILGKTNLPPLAFNPQTNNQIFGKTNNPWNVEYTPGGSSGGGAAAVAAGLSPLDIGTDGGGSLRVPAHFTGIFALKPTEYMVSLYGALPHPGTLELGEIEYNQWRHMFCPGPLARSIDDLKLTLSIIAGSDFNDANIPEIPIIYPKPKPLNKLRIAWTDQFPIGPKPSNDTKKAMKILIEKLKAKGIQVEKVQLPKEDNINGLKTAANLTDMEWMGPGLPSYVRFFMRLFGFSMSGGHVDTYISLSYEEYLKVLTRRDKVISKMEKFISNYDAWIVPASATTAFKHIIPKKWKEPIAIYKNSDINIDGKPEKYWVAYGSYSFIFSLTGNPVVSMPIGFTENNLPINVQVVGKRWQDARLLTVAEQLFKAGGDLRHPPNFK